MSNKKHAPATSRNREPILFELNHLLVATGKVLEIASGTGEHAAYFASHLPHLEWQPTDLDANSLKSIDAWAAEAGSDNILPALKIDVREESWPLGTVDAIFNANMIHISHFDACIGLIEGAKRHLVPRGLLILYGPYRINDAHTAESNDS
ncbi:class I SAM-dependent methyltransferase, partial [Myxococcota bacterium]|nr:class I SAM-dependent methyltransferase [Myxococcota bacterium]